MPPDRAFSRRCSSSVGWPQQLNSRFEMTLMRMTRSKLYPRTRMTKTTSKTRTATIKMTTRWRWHHGHRSRISFEERPPQNSLNEVRTSLNWPRENVIYFKIARGFPRVRMQYRLGRMDAVKTDVLSTAPPLHPSPCWGGKAKSRSDRQKDPEFTPVKVSFLDAFLCPKWWIFLIKASSLHEW